MDERFKEILEAVNYIKIKTKIKPRILIVLGSGFEVIKECIDVVDQINYSKIPYFQKTTVKGHKGVLIFGYINGVPVVLMQGRLHYYEGYNMEEIVFPIRVIAKLGVKNILLTNSSGGINLDYKPGDIMIIKDHISSFISSPLRGENIEELGKRFPDMTQVYDKEYIDLLYSIGKELNIEIKKGVYIQTLGPNFETPAEIKFYRMIGADSVGMSTACEAIVAKHADMKVCGISCISNFAAGIKDCQLTQEEVFQTVEIISNKLKQLISKFILHVKE